MTGEKNRIVTQEKLWGLDDEQLATPEHDNMILQLLDPAFYDKIGFADLHIDVIKSEVPIMNNHFIIGYWDIVASGYHSIFIEVKPKITSFGKVLRQLKTYLKYYPIDSWIYLYTPEERYDAAFESQGIKVIHPPKLP
jgi:hypothetical protein